MKDYLITTNFTGGNCKVLEMRNGFIRLEPELAGHTDRLVLLGVLC